MESAAGGRTEIVSDSPTRKGLKAEVGVGRGKSQGGRRAFGKCVGQKGMKEMADCRLQGCSAAS